MTEYILLFRKPGEKIYRQVNDDREASRFEVDDVFKMDVANNIWHIAPVPPRTINHPCPFPEEIPYRLIRMYSYLGDTVLDPFVGSGQTTKVAIELGRNAVGYDTKQEYLDYARSRLEEPLKVRPNQLIARFEKIPITLPPSNGTMKYRQSVNGEHPDVDPVTPRLLERPA